MSAAMDEIEARARRQLDTLRDLGDALSAISVAETSPDGLVRVVVDGNGALRDLTLAPGVHRLGARTLGAVIVATSALAAQRAFARRAAVTESFTEEFSELLSARPSGL